MTILTLETAAALASVSPEVIRRWIKEGLKATPVGRVGKRGPSDYRILEPWLYDFLEARSERLREPDAPQPPARPRKPGRKAKAGAREGGPLGPCPV